MYGASGDDVCKPQQQVPRKSELVAARCEVAVVVVLVVLERYIKLA